MKFIPQIRPIYWIYISTTIYLNFIIIIIIINTIYFKITIYKKKYYFNSWKWLW